MQAVETHRIAKDFPVDDHTVQVLFDISIQVAMGQLTMLVGPSGCGKTTLISIMAGILSPSSGTVQVLGAALTEMQDQEKVIFRRRHMGFIFQQYNLLPALTAAENAAMPLLANGMYMAQATTRAIKVLETMDMGPHVTKFPRQLSGGQQQRVAIARALVHDPQLIICDEPTAALDAQTGASIVKILKQVSSDPNRAVLVVTHDSRIYHFADRVLEMSDGRMVGDWTGTAFTEKGDDHG